MKRVLIATCFAMACAVGLAAEQTTGTTGATDQSGQSGRADPRTVTGCLRTGTTAGTYMLTDIQTANPRGGTAGPAGGTTAGGTAATGGGSATAGGGQRDEMPTSLMLSPADTSVDLKPHVGHKIEVTGTIAVGAGGAVTTGGTSAATIGGGTTTGGTATAGTAQTTIGSQRNGGMRTMEVTSIRMISESCD